MHPNIKAFLDMIAAAEGTAKLGDRGYNVLVGGKLFEGYEKHPKILVTVRPGLKSTAAGRYQFLYKTWVALQAMLDLPDFGPESQDLGAIELLTERKAIQDIEDGILERAIRKCAPTWASLPGAGYGQPERKLDFLRTAFVNAGGKITAMGDKCGL